MNYYVTDTVLLSLLSSCVVLQVLSNISIIIFSVQSIGILLTIRNKIKVHGVFLGWFLAYLKIFSFFKVQLFLVTLQ